MLAASFDAKISEHAFSQSVPYLFRKFRCTQLCRNRSIKLACEHPRRTLGPIKGGHILLGPGWSSKTPVFRQSAASSFASAYMSVTWSRRAMAI
jgi:hypothetical protein